MSQIQTLDQTILSFEQEIDIEATPEAVFEGMVRRLTFDHHGGPDGPPMPMELERRPGGRWFRNLGDDQGHLWGFVQSYRPPSLLELFGPMFMSYPVVGHLIIRFHAQEGGTRLNFRYGAFGLLQEDHRVGLKAGFGSLVQEVKADVEG